MPQLCERLYALGTFAQQNHLQAQHTQEQQYYKVARLHSFEPGDCILLLLPSMESKLVAKWQGPFKVTRQMGPMDYEV